MGLNNYLINKSNKQKEERLGLEKYNNQGCLMKIVEYNGCHDVIVEFQDEYKYKTKTRFDHFKDGSVKNLYYPSVHNIGIVGEKYKPWFNGKATREYSSWHNTMTRCFYEPYKEKEPTYKDVTCCNEWLLYENFYEWLHSQENFEILNSNNDWAIDKDILFKGNKIYSPETCCLVPRRVNNLFTKQDASRGDLPIGVHIQDDRYIATCGGYDDGQQYLGIYDTEIEAFNVYKEFKEMVIKQVAQEEYDKCNIAQRCYDAMMRYEVEITD